MHTAVYKNMLISCNLPVTVATAVSIITYNSFKAEKWLQEKKLL